MPPAGVAEGHPHGTDPGAAQSPGGIGASRRQPRRSPGVPVPTLPGPWVTTTMSAASTRRAATRALWSVTASCSPPKAWPTVIVEVSQPASMRPATDRRTPWGAHPIGHDVDDTQVRRFGPIPARIAGSAEWRSATTTGMLPVSPRRRQRRPERRGGRVLLVDGEEHLLLGRVARLDDVARPIDIRGADRGRRRRAPARRCPGP